ncbi:hypothetical protein, partial [Acinetobacter baumannii]|uniref:hypothetical protein n=1 Tax=Acinetobacter baumannii TaxID=470 RepID=UPI001C08CFDA
PLEQRELRQKKVDEAVRDLRQGGLFGMFGEALANPQDPYVISEIQRSARFFGQSLSPDLALEAAKKRFM